jgi:hypothetical protein
MTTACTTGIELPAEGVPRIEAVEAGEIRDPLRRISADGIDYGPCEGIVLAVILIPEPCELAWEAERAGSIW